MIQITQYQFLLNQMQWTTKKVIQSTELWNTRMIPTVTLKSHIWSAKPTWTTWFAICPCRKESWVPHWRSGATVSHFHNCHCKLAAYYAVQHGVGLCHDVTGLVKELDNKYVAEERLFIDSSSSSLEAALLNNGNLKPSIPIAHDVGMKETYETMITLLMLIKYSVHNWNICSDLKLVC